MTTEQQRFGDVMVTAVLDVSGTVPFDEVFAEGFPPPVPQEMLVRRYPDDYTDVGWRFRCRCFLVQSPGGIVLVDAGAGPVGSMVHGWLGLVGSLPQDLLEIGVDPSDVAHVVLTHGHGDHIGWAAIDRGGGSEPMFPNAIHHLHAADLAMIRAFEDDEDARWFDDVLGALEAADVLVATSTDDEVIPGVRLQHTPGHTPGHRVVRVSTGGADLVIAGDLLHFTHQLEDAQWLSPHDEDPAQALVTRRQVFTEMEGEGSTLASAHLPSAFSAIARSDGRRWFEPR